MGFEALRSRLARSAGQGWAARVRQVITGVLLLGAIGAALISGALRPLDDALSGLRFAASDRSASQTLTVVEIDSRSLRAAGAWPWDRSRYAEAIDTLMDAGATLVAVDVDFSAPSNAAADQTLAEAISRHPGQVVLPSFIQNDTYGARSSGLVETTPIPALRRDALLATVNVPVDEDGKVRSYEPASAAWASSGATSSTASSRT